MLTETTQRKPIVLTTLGVSILDVQTETDPEKLKSWKLQVDLDLNVVNGQLNDAKSKVYSRGEYADSDWFRRARSFRGVLTLFLSAINARLGALNRDKKAEQQGQWERVFVNVAKKTIDPELFNQIVEEVNQEFN